MQKSLESPSSRNLSVVREDNLLFLNDTCSQIILLLAIHSILADKINPEKSGDRCE